MNITEKDYELIARRIEENGETEGWDTIEYTKDDEILYIDYIFETEGYTEDETNAWVETDRSCAVGDVDLVNKDGELVAVEFDKRKLEKLVA